MGRKLLFRVATQIAAPERGTAARGHGTGCRPSGSSPGAPKAERQARDRRLAPPAGSLRFAVRCRFFPHSASVRMIFYYHITHARKKQGAISVVLYKPAGGNEAAAHRSFTPPRRRDVPPPRKKRLTTAAKDPIINVFYVRACAHGSGGLINVQGAHSSFGSLHGLRGQGCAQVH